MVKIEVPCGCVFNYSLSVWNNDYVKKGKICDKHGDEALEESYQTTLEENNKTIRKIKERYAEMRSKQ